MTAGDLITDAGQYEYSGLLLGHGTPHIVKQVTGLLGAADIIDTDISRQDSHGKWPGLAFADSRIVEFDVLGDYPSWTAAEAAVEALNMTFRYEQGFLPLVFSRPGQPTKYVNAEVRRREIDTSYELAHGILEGAVQLACVDPRKYSLVEHTDNMTILTGQTIVAKTITNAGNARAGLTITIHGPATNPVVANIDDGNKAVRFKHSDGSNLVMGAGDILIVDVAHRTVLFNYAELYELVTKDSDWWHLVPGTNRLVYSRQDMSASSSADLAFRDVWI